MTALLLLALVLLPVLAAGAAFAFVSDRQRPLVLPATAVVHLALSVAAVSGSPSSLGGWVALDPPGRLVLLLLSVLFAICAVYAVGYLHHRRELSNRVFVPCLLIFLAMTTLVVCSQHLGLMWVAVEAATLTTAPLIYFNRTARSIEATWKYLLVGSVGIALALLGSFFLAYASLGEDHPSLLFTDLVRRADRMNRAWLEVAFVLLLVGYGTKMGLAPMHTWKPDAYGEAPGVVGALLAGGLTNCAFLALVRVFHVCQAGGEGAFASRLLIAFGLLSIALAAVFMVGQRDFKRMLAYSSVEHMGILALGVGLGGAGVFAAYLHMLNNGLTKGVLFLAAANIHRAFDSKSIDEVRGALRRVPLSATLFLLGFFAITGSPPFGPFVSEFLIVSRAFAADRFWIGGGMLLLLLVVFVGMGRTVLVMLQGTPSAEARRTSYQDGLLTGLPMAVSMAIVLLLGLHVPAPIEGFLRAAAAHLEGIP